MTSPDGEPSWSSAQYLGSHRSLLPVAYQFAGAWADDGSHVGDF
jgi:hypothetical protein